MQLLTPIEINQSSLLCIDGNNINVNNSNINNNNNVNGYINEKITKNSVNCVNSNNSNINMSDGYHTIDDDNISDTDSDSDLYYNEGDVTLVDDDDINQSDPKNDAEKMFHQVMEVLRGEQEVCIIIILCYLIIGDCE